MGGQVGTVGLGRLQGAVRRWNLPAKVCVLHCIFRPASGLARPPALAAPCLLHVRPPGPVPALSPVTLTWRSVFSRHAATEQKGAETASATLPSQGDRWLQSCIPCPGVSIKRRRRSRSWRSTAPTGVSTAPRCLVNRDALCPGVCPSQLPSVVRVGGHHMT